MKPTRRQFVEGAIAATAAPALSRNPREAPMDTAHQLAAAIAAKRISAAEAVEAAIWRIEEGDRRINAVVVRDFDRARAAAKNADLAIASGDRRPLLGVPITVKESFDVAGLPTSWGIPQYARHPAATDAASVARLKAAGAIVLGKSNMHFQMGLFHGVEVPLPLHDWQSFNPVYGTTNNPWNPGRTPGGSSGGAAAALAAGFVPLELGSDVGGSIRAPAHFCGVHGHKATSGLVSPLGHVPPAAKGPPPPFPFIDMACFGPMARSAADLDVALSTLAEVAMPLARHKRLRDYRACVIDTHPLMPVSNTVRAMLDTRFDALGSAGARITRKSELLPDLAENGRAYMQALSAFDRLLGWPPDTIAALEKAAERLEPHDDSLAACRLRGAVLSPQAINDLARFRQALRSRWRRFFENFDVLLCPIMPTTAFPHDHSADQEARRIVVDGTPHPYMDQLFWPGVATFAGLPSTAVPLGLARDGLPVGMQVVGPLMGDRTTIAFALLMEEAFGPPPRLPA